MRIAIVALLTSFIAGIFAAATLKLMMMITSFVWDRDIALNPWYIVALCTLGGVLVGLTRIGSAHVESLGEQIEEAADPVHAKRNHIRLIALGAAVAVGFGGALGPEAGLIAVISELAALVSMVVARSTAEAQELGRASISAALAGLYASPPGGAVYAAGDDSENAWKRAREASIPYLGFLSAVAGVAGFWFAANGLFEGSFHRIHLPHHENPRDGTDMLYAVLPAIFGAAVGALFLHVRAFTAHMVETRIASPVAQSTLGGLAFGLLAAALPVVRFSGHHEFEPMLEWGAGAGAAALLGLALVKMLATTICLSTGWRGGAIFPLIFAGGAAGYAAHYLQSGPDLAVAVAAGLAGTTAAGMGKPLVALLVLVFLVGGDTMIPISVGIAMGMVAARLSPAPRHRS